VSSTCADPPACIAPHENIVRALQPVRPKPGGPIALRTMIAATAWLE
jgi:hypothetical protein